MGGPAKSVVATKRNCGEEGWPESSALAARGNQRCGFSGAEGFAGEEAAGALDFSASAGFAGAGASVASCDLPASAWMIFVVASLLTLQLRSQMRHCASVYWHPQVQLSALNL